MSTKSKVRRKNSKKRKARVNPNITILRLPSENTTRLQPTQVRPRMSDESFQKVLIGLVYVADDHMDEIPFPLTSENPRIGKHQTLDEVMMFFPDVKTKHLFPVSKMESFNGKHFLVGAFPDTTSPLGEVGLMYVCRMTETEPDIGEIMQFMLDCHDTNWVVKL